MLQLSPGERILEEKVLSDKNRLYLLTYLLDPEVARALNSNVRQEYVLHLETRWGGGSTYPRASWHLKEEDYRALHCLIKNERDWETVRDFLLRLTTIKPLKGINTSFLYAQQDAP